VNWIELKTKRLKQIINHKSVIDAFDVKLVLNFLTIVCLNTIYNIFIYL
jgi:hypothetical protein